MPSSRLPDVTLIRPQGSKLDIPVKVTFRTALQITVVKCTLKDRNDAVVPGYNNVDGVAVNSTGGSGADTQWTVMYRPFEPSGASPVTNGTYEMYFYATRSDGEIEPPLVMIIVTD